MSRFGIKSLRLIAPVTFAVGIGMGTLPAFAQTASSETADCSGIRFELANPTPGSMLEPGGFVVQGIATDERATTGPGIDRIDFFLDNRDLGGMNVGTAVPGMVPGPFGPDSFQTTIDLPDMTGGHDLFAYAHSAVNGAESVISVPVAIGTEPEKVGETPSDTMSEMCMAGPAGAMTPTTPVVTGNETAPPGNSSIHLDIANPTPGATILVGGYTISGTAMDMDATSGNGVDRVEIFLDNRDEGGTLLGTATPGTNGMWSTEVTLPKNDTGLHSLFFYAHSTVSDREMVVEIPVTVAP